MITHYISWHNHSTLKYYIDDRPLKLRMKYIYREIRMYGSSTSYLAVF